MGSKSRARLAKIARNRKSNPLARNGKHKKSKKLKVAPVRSVGENSLQKAFIDQLQDGLEEPRPISVPEIVEKPVNSRSKENMEQYEKAEEEFPETLDAIDSGDKLPVRLPKNIGKTRRQTRLEEELQKMKLMVQEKESEVQNITKQLHCSEIKCKKLQVIFDSSFKLKKNHRKKSTSCKSWSVLERTKKSSLSKRNRKTFPTSQIS